jgi:hypothetical protein
MHAFSVQGVHCAAAAGRQRSAAQPAAQHVLTRCLWGAWRCVLARTHHAAGIIAIDLARQMLQLMPSTYVLVVSTENITQNW